MDSRDRSIDDPVMKTSLEHLDADGGRIGAIVVCGDSRQQAAVRANIGRLGFPDRPFHTSRTAISYLRR